jgi:hypothetical protein
MNDSTKFLKASLVALGVCLVIMALVVPTGALGWGPFTDLVRPILAIAGISTVGMALTRSPKLYPISGATVVMAPTIRVLDALTQDRYALVSGPVILTVAGWTYIGLASVLVWKWIVKGWLHKARG